MVTERIELAPVGDAWAVKHEGGYLGYVSSRAEGARIAADLVDWLESRGRAAELVIEEPRSFSSTRSPLTPSAVAAGGLARESQESGAKPTSAPSAARPDG